MRLFAIGMVCLTVWGVLLVVPLAAQTSNTQATSTATPAATQPSLVGWDSAMEAARKIVDSSDRYMHHSRLRRGMTGYGLTVLAGTETVRFDVEILSVMDRWEPQRDVILARLSGAGLEQLGLAAGMSGSPVYIRDTDGKDKLIGAVAYGFIGCKEPLAGIQPITQMLAVGKRSGGTAGEASSRGNLDSRQWDLGDQWAKMALGSRTMSLTDVARVLASRSAARTTGGAAMAPLATAMAVAGLGPNTMSAMDACLRPLGFVTVQAGSAGAEQRSQAMLTGFIPGGAIAIPLATGDADFSAVGTVTDVSGQQVLAFGHAMFAEGDVEFPIAPAYVHTVVPGLIQSFKLASAAEVTGTLLRDLATGVSGVEGPKPSMIPMTLTLEWSDDGRRQRYEYQVIRHRLLTPVVAASLVFNTAENWRTMPADHTVRHSVDIQFADWGTYHASDVRSGQDVLGPAGDLLRAMLAMLTTPLGPPAKVERIDVNIAIEPQDRSAEILELRLDGSVYRPGQTVRGSVVLKPYRKDRVTLPVEFTLPEDLADGSYALTACDEQTALSQRMTEMPQRFAPRTVGELFESLGESAGLRGDCLYLRLPLQRGGLAVGGGELGDLPDSRQRIINESTKLDLYPFGETKVQTVATEYVLSGSLVAEFQVLAKPAQTVTDQQRNP